MTATAIECLHGLCHVSLIIIKGASTCTCMLHWMGMYIVMYLTAVGDTVEWETFEGENFHEFCNLRAIHKNIFIKKFCVCHTHLHVHVHVRI